MNDSSIPKEDQKVNRPLPFSVVKVPAKPAPDLFACAASEVSGELQGSRKPEGPAFHVSSYNESVINTISRHLEVTGSWKRERVKSFSGKLSVEIQFAREIQTQKGIHGVQRATVELRRNYPSGPLFPHLLVSSDLLCQLTEIQQVLNKFNEDWFNSNNLFVSGDPVPSEDMVASRDTETNPRVSEQVAPIKNSGPASWDLVIEDMKDRDNFGEKKYQQRLQPNNGRDALIDAYQEALDLVVYLRNVIYERDGK